MARFNAFQSRIALIVALLFYMAAIGALMVWLALNAEDTVQKRLDATPVATATLSGKETSVPSSWQEKPEEAATQEPEAMPESVKPEPSAAEEDALVKNLVDRAVENMSKPTDGEMPEPQETVAPEAVVDAAQEPVPEPTPEPVAEPVVKQLNWQKYARSFNQSDTRPRIGLVIAELGLASNATQAAIQELPGEVTLAFASTASGLESWISKARVAGHETVLSVPMEPENYPHNDPGPNTLLLGLDDADNVSRLRWALARSEGYVAVMPSMGQKFVTAEKKLSPVLDAVREQGLMVFDGTMARDSLIAPLSRLGKIPFARTDIILDAAATRLAIEAQLEQLEKTAREKGHAVAIALPYPVTFDRLKEWIPTLEKKGLVLAPLTALASEDVNVTP